MPGTDSYGSTSLSASNFNAKMDKLLVELGKSNVEPSTMRAVHDLIRSATIKVAKGRLAKAEKWKELGVEADEPAEEEDGGEGDGIYAADGAGDGRVKFAHVKAGKSMKSPRLEAAKAGKSSRRLKAVPRSTTSIKRKFDLEYAEISAQLTSVLGNSGESRRTLHVGDSCSLPMPEEPGTPLLVALPVRSKMPLALHMSAPKSAGDAVYTLCASFASDLPSPEKMDTWSQRAFQNTSLFILDEDPRYVVGAVLNIAVYSSAAPSDRGPPVIQLSVAPVVYQTLTPGKHVREQLVPGDAKRLYKIKFADAKTGTGAMSMVVEFITLRGEAEAYVSWDAAHAVPSPRHRLWFLNGTTATRLQVDPIVPLYKNNCNWYIGVEMKDPNATASVALRAFWQPYPPKSYQQLTSSLANALAEEDERARLTNGRRLSMAEAHALASKAHRGQPAANGGGNGTSLPPLADAAEGDGEEGGVQRPGLALPRARGAGPGAGSVIAKDPFLLGVAARHEMARHTQRANKAPWEPARVNPAVNDLQAARLASERAQRRASVPDRPEAGVPVHEVPAGPESIRPLDARDLVASRFRDETARGAPQGLGPPLASPGRLASSYSHSGAYGQSGAPTPPRVPPLRAPHGGGRPGRSPYEKTPFTTR